MHSFLRQNAQIFTVYILFARKINEFVLDVSVHFTSYQVHATKPLCAKLFEISFNKYLGTKCLKRSNKKNFELYQVFMCRMFLNIL